MYVLVETDPTTKKSDSFTFENFEELHTWVTTRVPEESRKLNSLQGFLGELHSWATKHKADQNIIQSFMNHFNPSQVANTVVEDSGAEETTEKPVEKTAEETTAAPEKKEPHVTESPYQFHWNVPATGPIARLDWEQGGSGCGTFSTALSDEINDQFDIVKNAPKELKPLEIVADYIFAGYGKEIDNIQYTTKCREISNDDSKQKEYTLKECDANIKLNEFCKWFGNTFIQKNNSCMYHFRERTSDGKLKYQDLYSETSVKMCMLLTAIFGKKVLVATKFDTNTVDMLTHNTEMPSEFDTVFEVLTPMRIYHKLCMSVTSPYDTIKWETNFIPYFQILRVLRSIEPANHDGKWEALAFKLTARYIIELFDMHHVSNNIYPDYMADIVQLFITLNLKQSDGSSIQSSELYASFTKFIETVFMNDTTELMKLCKVVISPNINSKMFANELKANGIQSVRKAAGIFYTGIEASKEGATKEKSEKTEPQPQNVFESDSWKAMYGSGTAIELGEKLEGISEKLIKKKPAIVAAPKIVNLRDVHKTAAPKPNLSVLE
jgi:hypothetical protein